MKNSLGTHANSLSLCLKAQEGEAAEEAVVLDVLAHVHHILSLEQPLCFVCVSVHSTAFRGECIQLIQCMSCSLCRSFLAVLSVL